MISTSNSSYCVHCVLSNDGLNPQRCGAEQLLTFCNGWKWGCVLILVLTCHIEDYGVGCGVNHAGSDSDLIYLWVPVIPQVRESSHLRYFVKHVTWGFAACVALQGYSQLESSNIGKKEKQKVTHKTMNCVKKILLERFSSHFVEMFFCDWTMWLQKNLFNALKMFLEHNRINQRCRTCSFCLNVLIKRGSFMRQIRCFA